MESLNPWIYNLDIDFVFAKMMVATAKDNEALGEQGAEADGERVAEGNEGLPSYATAWQGCGSAPWG